MSERSLKLLVGALVVAVGFWAVSSLVSGGSGSIRASGGMAGFFSEVDPTSVSALVLTRPDETVELRRTNGVWTANGFAADTAAVTRFVSQLAGISVGDLVAANPANHARMGVSVDSAVSFTVVQEGGEREIMVGNTGPRFGTAYGRLPAADEVYLIEGDLRIHTQRGLDEWRNKELFALDTTVIARIEITRDSDDYVLVRGDSLWTFEDGSEANAGEVGNVLAELSASVAAGFLTDADSLAAEPLGASNRAFGPAGEMLVAVMLGRGDAERWARVAGDSIVYRMSTFRVGRLVPTLESMRPPE